MGSVFGFPVVTLAGRPEYASVKMCSVLARLKTTVPVRSLHVVASAGRIGTVVNATVNARRNREGHKRLGIFKTQCSIGLLNLLNLLNNGQVL